MNTLVLEEMPDLFWQQIKRKNYQKYFLQETKKKEEIKILIIRTKTVMDKNFIDKFPSLKLIIRAGTGYDNIDIKYAYKKLIAIQNTPYANTLSAYEHTISMIFALIKQLNKAKNNVITNKWKKGLSYNLEISDLKVLVVGVGRIGSKVAKTLQYFGAKVKGVDPYLSKKDWINFDIEPISYKKGLEYANLITFHCPLTSKTKNYFSLNTLSYLKNPIYLINTARGNIVSEAAIIKGLEKNLILGVGLDVYNIEPWKVKKFAQYDNVILTPHIGAYTLKAKNRMALETIKVWENFVFKNKLTYKIKTYD